MLVVSNLDRGLTIVQLIEGDIRPNPEFSRRLTKPEV